MERIAWGIAAAALAGRLAVAAEPIPEHARQFLAENCLACHSGEQAQAGVRLDITEADWSARASARVWERVYGALRDAEMPPEGVANPPRAERDGMVAWLGGQLLRHWPVGGTVPRRLNREEYANTIRDLFGMLGFRLPEAFPADDTWHGFDNVAEGLVLSPPLMAQYLAVANSIADEILPPETGPPEARSKRYALGTRGLAVEGGGLVDGGAFRIVSSRNMASAAAWPARFEARQSGVYRVTLRAVPYQTGRMSYERRMEPFRLALYGRPKADQVYAPFGEIRKLAEMDLRADVEAGQARTAEVELAKGEIFGIRWVDGPAFSDPPSREYSRAFLADRLRRDRLYYAAMLAFRGGPRGTTQAQLYDATKALMESGDLDLADPRLRGMPEVWGGGLGNAPHNWIKAFVHEELLRHGPAVDIVDLEVEGPIRLVEDDETRERKARTRRFLGRRAAAATDREHIESVLRRFLPRAFRRPVAERELLAYADMAAEHLGTGTGARVEDGLHVALRRALVSPHFLYRGHRPGRLDDYALASRLSYFLTSAPPDGRLRELARDGLLSDPAVLAAQAERLIRSPGSARFVSSFTGQWLSTRLLRGIMPDPRLLKFYDPDRAAMVEETEMFFDEVMRKNLTVGTLIDPGFSYRSARLNKIYGTDLQGNQMRRVTFERGGRFGGILGLASVMMATANGVDTHPVLRGVWVLENVFGDPPPDPPANVPAIAPDTSGATTMLDQLAAHRSDPACATCHSKIDPLGIVLENYDPVGRWRDHYPVYTRPPDGAEALEKEFYSTVGDGALDGPEVYSVGVLGDGTRLDGAQALKRYVLERLDQFSECLAEKLLMYATGRSPTFGDRRVVERIVESNARNGNGFRDLIVEVVLSDSFAAR